MIDQYKVVSFEEDRNTCGFVVMDKDAKWGDFMAKFYGDSQAVRDEAQKLCDQLNSPGGGMADTTS